VRRRKERDARSEAKKNKVHTPKFKAQVGLESLLRLRPWPWFGDALWPRQRPGPKTPEARGCEKLVGAVIRCRTRQGDFRILYEIRER